MKDDCIFCKLANGIIPTNDIYEDDDFKVIMDAEPATRGHALILPKAHSENIMDIDPEVSSKVLPLAGRICTHMKKVLGCDGINILQNNGSQSGQTVFHFHVHIIPRYKGGDGILTWSHEDISADEIKDIRDRLKM